jgi:hypothetical protein
MDHHHLLLTSTTPKPLVTRCDNSKQHHHSYNNNSNELHQQQRSSNSNPTAADANSTVSWGTLHSILHCGRGEQLAQISTQELRRCLEPLLEGLRLLDAEALLQLERVPSGGARLRDG